MVKIIEQLRRFGQRNWCLGIFASVGLLGVVICGYGYAAVSTDLLIEGRASVFGNFDIRNTGVKVLSKTDGAMEAYNAEFTSNSASMYPEVTTKNGKITYEITTCNYSKDKTYELVGLDEPATSIGSLESGIAKVEVGTDLVLGTKVAPGECVQTEVSFIQTKAADTVGSMTLDYTWKEYDGVPFDIEYMQEMTPAVCAATSKRETKQLIDQRDGHKYWVTKMHDGNCWMAQDMDYDGGGDVRYTRADVDALAWDNDGTSSPAQYMYNGDNAKGHESDGSYYSYQAAMAVCPKGWRLATGGAGGEWDGLLDVAELNALGNSGSNSWSDWWDRVAEAPFYLRLTGYTDGVKGMRGYEGTRTGWTSTRSGARPNTSMAIGWGDEYLQQKYFVDWDDTNFYGEPARCIAKNGNDAQVKELLTIDTMQEMTTSVCAVSQIGDAKQLVDERDGKKYWITKLPDEQCWMTQNLDYDGGGTRYTDGSDLSTWDSTNYSNPANYYYRGDNDKGRESEGSLYSYKASLNVCPAGWRLPIGGTNGDYYNLLGDNPGTSTSAMNTAAKVAALYVKNPYFFVYGGWVDGHDGLVHSGDRGNWRSARVVGDSNVYTLDISVKDKVMRSIVGDDFHWGESVRCVYGDPAQEPQDIYTVDTMQEMTPQICANTTTSDEKTRRLMTDTRDGHKYWVSKLSADGNCWMVQNLDYDGGGTKFDASSDKTKWTMTQTGSPTQYYYRGDWADGLKSYGTLYSWYAAQNVCPVNWRLPTGGPGSEEEALLSGIANTTAGINKMKAAPFYFVGSGFYENSGLNNEGQEGYWWSSTPSSTGGYVMTFNTKGKGTTASPYVRKYWDEGGYWGESVRCMMSGN